MKKAEPKLQFVFEADGVIIFGDDLESLETTPTYHLLELDSFQ
ncbi:MAG: hypothetical protein O7F74_02075 [Bacteroidetes bacterium]|nr:hypothetical protein [Bacteroidota bacterium]